jgi:type VI secretion system protein ImpM
MAVHGIFGKLPSEGDFVDRGWRPGARDGLDRFLQAAIAGVIETALPTKETLAAAPDLALSFRPGVLGEDGVVAVVVASRDRVGRSFPLCAGVQWSAGEEAAGGWPSVGYARAVGACVRRAIADGADPDALLRALVAIGDPRDFEASFAAGDGDDTLPRIAAEAVLLQVAGPPAALAPPLAALCVVLAQASDLLGMRVAAQGEVQDLFACRELAARDGLAALFDGQWATHGWGGLERPAANAAIVPETLHQLDDDSTRSLPAAN